MVSTAVAGVTKFRRMPMEVVAAGSPAFRTADIFGSHFKKVLQTVLICAEALRKAADEGPRISFESEHLVQSLNEKHLVSSHTFPKVSVRKFRS